MMERYRIVNQDKEIKVYINDIIHLSFLKQRYIGLQSFISTGTIPNYYIEVYFIGNDSIILEYNNREDWVQILKLLEVILLEFN